MTLRTKNILFKIFLNLYVFGTLTSTFVYFYFIRGRGLIYSLFTSVLFLIFIPIMAALLYIAWWRVFTPEGRAEERRIQEEIKWKKLQRKREREWRDMNE